MPSRSGLHSARGAGAIKKEESHCLPLSRTPLLSQRRPPSHLMSPNVYHRGPKVVQHSAHMARRLGGHFSVVPDMDPAGGHLLTSTGAAAVGVQFKTCTGYRACPNSESCAALNNGVIKVYNEDNTSRLIEVQSDITAQDVCQLFVLKNQCIDDHNWTLFEHLPHLGIERTIEDHESVMEVLSGWGMDTDSRLYFRKNFAKYEFFRRPLDFFPDHMVSLSSETNGMLDHSQLLQTFLNSSACPEVHGHLYAKEQSRKSWRKFFFVLRRSGLYFSNKGTSKDPRHLQLIASFSDSDVYSVLSAKKLHGAPTDYGLCVKSSKCSSTRDLKLLCADDGQTRTCWITAMRLFKYGTQLYQNFIQPHQKQKASPMRSISENSLVAMDFSGQKSRVIENPSEALSVAVEEGLSWRKKSCNRLSCHGSPSTSQSLVSNMGLHLAQVWFHGKMSRDEAQRLITQQGLVDGVFLLRDSQTNPKTFVLSLCHMQKIKHFQIVPMDDEEGVLYSLDDGNTRFTDLIQLVEFYQLNRGVLPCKLKHHCARITL